MDVAEFINQDILIYLDEALDEIPAQKPEETQADTGLFLTRDYQKELAEALDHSDFSAGRKVIFALKKVFDECPDNTLEKKQLKELLTELYEKFRYATESAAKPLDQKSPQQYVNPFGQQATPPIQYSAPVQYVVPLQYIPPMQTPPAMQQVPVARQLPPLPAAPEPDEKLTLTDLLTTEKPVDEKEEARKNEQQKAFAEIEALLDKAQAQLKNDLRGAIHTYRNAKIKALQNPIPVDLKLKFQKTYDLIKKVLPVEHKQLPQSASTVENLDKHLLLQLEQEKHSLDVLLQKKSIAAAKEQLQRMQSLAYQIQDHEKAGRAIEKLLKIKEIIDGIKVQANEQHLVAVP
jgi:hypothetical protein